MERPTPDDLIVLNRGATVARLLPGLAHEVNNALLVIAGTAELLEEQPGCRRRWAGERLASGHRPPGPPQ